MRFRQPPLPIARSAAAQALHENAARLNRARAGSPSTGRCCSSGGLLGAQGEQAPEQGVHLSLVLQEVALEAALELVIGADGDETALRDGLERAWARFQTVLPELVSELPALREAVTGRCGLRAPGARAYAAPFPAAKGRPRPSALPGLGADSCDGRGMRKRGNTNGRSSSRMELLNTHHLGGRP